VIYIEQSAAVPTCDITPDSSGSISELPVDFSSLEDSGHFSHDGKTWKPARAASAVTNGTVSITCSGTSFLVGDVAPIVFTGVSSILGGTAALLGLPCFGFVLALIIGLITAIRRSGSKKRLQAEYAAHQGFPPAGPYGPPGHYRQPGPYGPPGQYPPPY
jgi:hypothetical protein